MSKIDELIKLHDNLIAARAELEGLSRKYDIPIITGVDRLGCIHIFGVESLRELAAEVSADVQKEPHTDNNPYKYFFWYKYKQFFALGE